MARNRRVFPFFLDGGIQSVSGSGTTAWDGTSSFVEFTGSGSKTITVGTTDKYDKPIHHGTMVVVKRTAARGDGSLTVDPTSEFSTNDASIVLRGPGDHVVLLWKSPSGDNAYGEWVELTFFHDDSVFSGDLDISGNATFNGSARFASFSINSITPQDQDGNDQTVSVAELQEGLIVHTPAAANDSIILPTAALLEPTLSNVGDSIRVCIHNDSATHDSTVEMGTGGALVGSDTIGEGEVAEFLINMTNVTDSTEAYTVYRL